MFPLLNCRNLLRERTFQSVEGRIPQSAESVQIIRFSSNLSRNGHCLITTWPPKLHARKSRQFFGSAKRCPGKRHSCCVGVGVVSHLSVISLNWKPSLQVLITCWNWPAPFCKHVTYVLGPAKRRKKSEWAHFLLYNLIWNKRRISTLKILKYYMYKFGLA